ncbi:MAG: rod shape-determining protein MreC [Victivallales bacterium]|nr:rod shape-determining protein MreC [Victivallales bacterium]
MLNKRFAVLSAVIGILSAAVLVQIFHRPLHRLTSDFYHPFFSPLSKVENLSAKQALMLQSKDALVEELLALQRVNEQFSADLNVLREVAQENSSLKDLLGIKPVPGFRCVFSEVFLRDPTLWNESFSINKGSADGIVPGCIVLCRITKEKGTDYVFAVAGRISKVASHRSQVETVVGRDCRLSVILRESGAAGILEGGTVAGGRPVLKAGKLPATKTYKAGESVITSGLGGDTTPALLLVGRVGARGGTPDVRVVNNLYAEALVEPAADFNNLRHIVVLVPKEQ